MGQSSSLQLTVVWDKEEAQRRLNVAESMDGYLAACEAHDMNEHSRRDLAYQATTMTPREYRFFQVVLENAKDHLPLRLTQDLSEVFFVQVMPRTDGGMPHTRPQLEEKTGLVVYPDITRHFGVETVIHELWHVHQRLFPGVWESIFRELGWERWEGRLPEGLEMARRINPDTIDSPLWCFQRTWVPVPIFQNIRRPKVNEVNIWFYHVSLKYHIKSVPKEMQWAEMGEAAYEHPREWVAHVLASPGRYEGSKAITEIVRVMGASCLPRSSADK